SSGSSTGYLLFCKARARLFIGEDCGFQLLHVLKPLRPGAVSKCYDAANGLCQALDQHKKSTEWNQCLQGPNRLPRGAIDRDFADHERSHRIRIAINEQRQKAGKEEEDV